ncbi:MAG TPA: nucleotide exchange factor GrpE [Terriglobales bacterium]|nr:nucleotide exchange factor GrpE [Terriglobales bacterium]
MTKLNEQERDPELDLEHELPPAEQEAEAAAPVSPELEALRGEIEKVKTENAELRNRMARMQADFENARRRAAREQQEFRDYALTDLIRSLLPVLDSFDRALASDASGDNFRAGMELIGRQFHDALAKIGVAEVPAQGQPFDPTVHEAIEMVDSTEVPDNHVLQELQRGYKLKDRLLRPAMVRVARNSGQ